MANFSKREALASIVAGALVFTICIGCSIAPGKGGQTPSPPTSKPVVITETNTADRTEAMQDVKGAKQKRVLLISKPSISPATISPGGIVVQVLEYTVLAPKESESAKLTQIVRITNRKDIEIDLLNRELERKQGTYMSQLKVVLPRDLDPGTYELQTLIVWGDLSKTAKGEFRLSP